MKKSHRNLAIGVFAIILIVGLVFVGTQQFATMGESGEGKMILEIGRAHV